MLRHVVALVLAAVLIPCSTAAAARPAGPSDLLPDMKMAPLYGMSITTTDSGRKRLTFGTIGWNVGLGPIELRGRKIDDGSMEMRQVIYNSAGGHRIRHTSAIAIFDTGDHHNHWHVRQFMRVQLYRVGDPGGNVYGVRKIGYCLLDARRMAAPPPNSPTSPVYPLTACGNSASTRLRMGLSVGYGDDYPPNFAHQWIDITGLPKGDYRICTTVDPLSEFQETREDNNQRWTDVRINLAKDKAQVVATKAKACGPGVG